MQNLHVSLGLQKSPLIKIDNFGDKYGFGSLYVKDESKNPTGSFKDRENVSAINIAIEYGIKKVFTVSSGNAAVSTAAFAQKAGIQCNCIVTNTLSVGKRFLINLYGGNLIEKIASYEELYRWAIDSHYEGWNCTPGLNPIKEEGIKLIGYEIWEEMGVPDIIVVPCGNGTLLYGIYKAFKELQLLNYVNTLPQLIGIQIKNAAPLKKALETGSDYITLGEVHDSIAEGIIALESYSSPKVMMALKETGGTIVEVSDSEIRESMQEIISLESLIPEPTAAVVYAGVKKLFNVSDKKIVLVQTAGGMKNLKEIMGLLINKGALD
ncbi:hypothetical protein A3D80_01180 [Candidatus Roizmanbacteria bacterium RIFCSPHIGHO2_02_FULL_40_13b]|uniref:Tryptophan synthase beta chain-like PALP domain-containing protein n=1 Tax=Candidatus Roizmanbacteria bacterium RIFCSPHIGHO2_01_FULL_39_24 TaxID=1802032 RepID=A0A1F7GI16_9BACT|nr:MAG: hypothetical protein A2799_03005 [Candidatus Roizmanbacteria bacterium RIFCSPHIGHO2_01_FULL_39_24]OGK26338.1 MAG: hypothetical protein A3D80_01180 [Candidatus Roizmanbacteria bacterium RIFCSPHIGHO2_02_FULL_40_13b]OGK50151.1 MAG: hypothetical protein A3A56_00525 [Candidatus Roizmanbacteria bacterium RIFCSPLOWO2_01_FULL_40_32]OGK56818.1 MAG: hypothetical protein A3H83_03725 [Candidatus Roizmanbacteria bacterium RIFCSPLOWO2_02_FULL_39_8]